MTSLEKALRDFAQFAAKLKGDEKSEAQTFLFHLLEAFGHDSNTLPEGCKFEYRVRVPGERTKFADIVWSGRLPDRDEIEWRKISKHYQQTFDYWLNLVPHRPPYVVLSNFDEFWICDFKHASSTNRLTCSKPRNGLRLSAVMIKTCNAFTWPPKPNIAEPVTPPPGRV